MAGFPSDEAGRLLVLILVQCGSTEDFKQSRDMDLCFGNSSGSLKKNNLEIVETRNVEAH